MFEAKDAAKRFKLVELQLEVADAEGDGCTVWPAFAIPMSEFARNERQADAICELAREMSRLVGSDPRRIDPGEVKRVFAPMVGIEGQYMLIRVFRAPTGRLGVRLDGHEGGPGSAVVAAFGTEMSLAGALRRVDEMCRILGR